jgi:hypothetical protein
MKSMKILSATAVAGLALALISGADAQVLQQPPLPPRLVK